MAFNADTLKELGVDEDLVDRIIKAHNEDITGSYIPKTRFDEINGELKEMKKGVAQRDEQIAQLKSFEGDNESLKSKVAELEKTNQESAQKYATQIETIRKQNAVNALITDAQDAGLVLGQIDMSKVSVNEDGSITGAKEQIDALRQSKSFLFKNVDNGSSVHGGGQPPQGGTFAGANRTNKAQADYGKRLAEAHNAGVKATQSATEYYFGRSN